MPKQGKTPKKKSKEKTPQKSGESEYPAMDQDASEFNRLFQNTIEQSQAQLQQTHEEQIKRLEADREAEIKVSSKCHMIFFFPLQVELLCRTVFLPCVMVFADLSSEKRCGFLQKFMNSL